MAIRVAINGFGRIGRLVLRSIVESGRRDVEVVSINDLGPVATNAHLLRYDSVHGRFPASVTVEGDLMIAAGHKIKVTAIKDPATLPHKELDVDIVMESTGIFTARAKAAAHLTAGAKRVIVSAPSDGEATITRLAPAVRCAAALARAVKMPVDSITISTSNSLWGRVAGSLMAVTLIL
jgi:glyceraldehyde 3-phosphate dehydrogenase